MKKLMLDLNELKVDTFEALAAQVPAGTVVGYGESSAPLGCAWQCYESPQNTDLCTLTCQESIDFPCPDSVDYPCI